MGENGFDFEKQDMNNNNVSIDNFIDKVTDYGKGTIYYTCDGKKCASLEQVMEYNQLYYDMMMNRADNTIDENKAPTK